MKKIILLCMLMCIAMFPCVSTTSGINNIQPKTVKMEQKKGSNSAESILVKRESKTTELEGTWLYKSDDGEFTYLDVSGNSVRIKAGTDDLYYVSKGSLRIKKDGSGRISLSAMCEVKNGVNTFFAETSQLSEYPGIQTSISFKQYSVDGDTLTIDDDVYTRCTEEIDWRMFK